MCRLITVAGDLVQRSAPRGDASTKCRHLYPPAARLSARMRAFLLATSAGQRARLMLPTGVLSGVEFPVTSKYVDSLAAIGSFDFRSRVSRATVWKGASASLHSTLAFSIQKRASRCLPQ